MGNTTDFDHDTTVADATVAPLGDRRLGEILIANTAFWRRT